MLISIKKGQERECRSAIRRHNALEAGHITRTIVRGSYIVLYLRLILKGPSFNI